MHTPRGLVLVALGTLSACGSVNYGRPADVARNTLSRANACPDERITVRARPDLAPRAWSQPPPDPARPAPPPEVAADGERADLWKRQHRRDEHIYDEERDRTMTARAHRQIVQANGCGQEVLYYCGLNYKMHLRCAATTLEALRRVDEKAGLVSRATP